MAWYSSRSSTVFLLAEVVVVVVVVVVLGWGKCEAFGTFGFDIHHRFSDPIKGILAVDELPEKGSVNYYAVMAHRDRLIKGRRLASLEKQTPVTFSNGNDTYRIEALGFLHYANISVGTPPASYLVALDTGSDLFWLPCDCTSCVHGLKSSTGEIDFNIYSTNTSSTGSKVPCNNSFCARQAQCPSANSNCPYQVRYLSNGTSSTGILVEDLLHLISDDDEPEQSKPVDAQITFGCGQVQTGSFLDGAAPNGLFGLGMADISVPSILSKAGLASNSFSMCFGQDGMGRISFGDKGSANQGETPFNLRQSHPTYNISISQISVGGHVGGLEFSAIIDSGTSFTYLNDPAYTLISESFNTMALDKRHSSDSNLPFEYCYDLSSNNKSIRYPIVSLTMKGGEQFPVNDPIIVISTDSGDLYCLGVVKSDDVNIIGQNFMTGYRIVFDREKMVLGWSPSDCFSNELNTLPVSPPKSKAASPAVSVNPEATVIPTPGVNGSPQLNPLTCALLIILFLF